MKLVACKIREKLTSWPTYSKTRVVQKRCFVDITIEIGEDTDEDERKPPVIDVT